jgi:hypothetical protein
VWFNEFFLKFTLTKLARDKLKHETELKN